MHDQAFLPPPEVDLALAYAARPDRPLLASFFSFDQSLARAVAVASEPIVGQMRLAWWRDAMSLNPAARPRGNPQFDDLSLHFGEHLTDLVAMVDGWEVLLLADRLDREAVAAFAAGRTTGWQAVVAAMGCDGNDEFVHDAAKSWALADIASKLDNPGERDLVLDFAAESMATPVRLPRRLRPLAVLAALSRRSLRQGGTALMSGRSSALTALRAGMFGR